MRQEESVASFSPADERRRCLTFSPSFIEDLKPEEEPLLLRRGSIGLGSLRLCFVSLHDVCLASVSLSQTWAAQLDPEQRSVHQNPACRPTSKRCSPAQIHLLHFHADTTDDAQEAPALLRDNRRCSFFEDQPSRSFDSQICAVDWFLSFSHHLHHFQVGS